MMKRTKSALSLFVLAAALLLSSSALADTMGLSLAAPIQTGVAGATLSFNATAFTPIANTGTIFLNSDSFNLVTGLTISDDGFFNNFPFTLDPGTSFSGLLFTIKLSPSIAAGQYLGSFSILGGGNDSALNKLATVNYTINVGSTTSPVPEPESLMLLATGLPGLAMVVRSKRHLFTSRKAA